LKVKVTTPGSEGDWLREPGRAVACILLFLGENCDRRRFQSSMPTYEYSCEKCDGTFEIVQSMRDESLRECPKELCRQKKWGHGKVKRLIGTGAGLIFKGSGFYITDYRSDSYKEAAKKDAPAAPAAAAEKTTGSKEAKTSTTPAAPAKAAEAKPKKQAAE
jgi:putative FmdB family regulatory protein